MGSTARKGKQLGCGTQSGRRDTVQEGGQKGSTAQNGYAYPKRRTKTISARTEHHHWRLPHLLPTEPWQVQGRGCDCSHTHGNGVLQVYLTAVLQPWGLGHTQFTKNTHMRAPVHALKFGTTTSA